MDPGSCTPGDVTPDSNAWIIQTFCPLAGVARVRIDLGEREDTANVALPVATTVIAGPGADHVTVSGAAGEVTGGDGNDYLAGGPAGDVLSGGQGTDGLDGGGGADRLLARDGVSDGVRCGPGADSVDADTLDWITSDCEKVTRTLTAPPEGEADDGRRPRLDVGAPTIQRLGSSRSVYVYATSTKRGAISASGFLDIAGLSLPVRTDRRQIRVGGGGVRLTYRLSRSRWRSVAAALRKRRRVVMRLGVVATDLAGRSQQRNAPRIRLLAGSPRARAAHNPDDLDADGVLNADDNCPTVPNASQLNTDASLPGGDAQGDACDDDDDADGVLDAAPDNCPVDPNPGQEDTDGDGRGDACELDTDMDTVFDDDDNCDQVPNPDQSDLNGDGQGDLCDPDDDGDGHGDGSDNCPTVWNADQADRDGDGLGTLCDPQEPVVTGPAGNRSPLRLTMVVGRTRGLAAVAAGLVVRLGCSEACGATAKLGLSRRDARRLRLGRSLIVARGSARLRGAGTTYAFVRFTRRTMRALARGRRVRVTLTAVAVDDAGNRRSSRRTFTLSR
jgi:hypothetical protein